MIRFNVFGLRSQIVLAVVVAGGLVGAGFTAGPAFAQQDKKQTAAKPDP